MASESGPNCGKMADAGIDAAGREPAPVKQQALWAVAQREAHEDVCATPLFDLLQVFAHSPRVDLGDRLQLSLAVWLWT